MAFWSKIRPETLDWLSPWPFSHSARRNGLHLPWNLYPRSPWSWCSSPPEPSGNPGPPTAFPDGRVFYYPVKHYTRVLWYWFIYLFVSVPQALVRDVFVPRVGIGAFERIKYIAGICSRPSARQVIVSEPRAPADTTTNAFEAFSWRAATQPGSFEASVWLESQISFVFLCISKCWEK